MKIRNLTVSEDSNCEGIFIVIESGIVIGSGEYMGKMIASLNRSQAGKLRGFIDKWLERTK